MTTPRYIMALVEGALMFMVGMSFLYAVLSLFFTVAMWMIQW